MKFCLKFSLISVQYLLLNILSSRSVSLYNIMVKTLSLQLALRSLCVACQLWLRVYCSPIINMIRRMFSRQLLAHCMRFSSEANQAIRPVAPTPVKPHQKHQVDLNQEVSHLTCEMGASSNLVRVLSQERAKDLAEAREFLMENISKSSNNMLINFDNKTVLVSSNTEAVTYRSYRWASWGLATTLVGQVILGSFSLVTIGLTAGLWAAALWRYLPRRALYWGQVLDRVNQLDDNTYEFLYTSEGKSMIKELKKTEGRALVSRVVGPSNAGGLYIQADGQTFLLPANSVFNNLKYEELFRI